jgi:hypothetical protein
MLDRKVMKTEEKPTGNMLFLPQEVVQREVWTRGLHKMHSIDDGLHGERCSQLFIHMSGCNIFFNRNLRFRVIKIKTEQGLLQYLVNHRESQVQSR